MFGVGWNQIFFLKSWFFLYFLFLHHNWLSGVQNDVATLQIYILFKNTFYLELALSCSSTPPIIKCHISQ